MSGINGTPEVSDPVDAAAIAGLFGVGQGKLDPKARAVAHQFGHRRGYSCAAINTLIDSAFECLAKTMAEDILRLVLDETSGPSDQPPVWSDTEP